MHLRHLLALQLGPETWGWFGAAAGL